MVDAIKTFFLETVGEELCVFFCSLLPIIECRGAVPMGAIFGLPWWQTMLFSIVGNILPVPFILLFIRKMLRWMQHCKIKFFNRISNWLNAKVEKHKDKIEKYSYWGVMLFVALPVPGTGAWTGTLIASVLEMEPKKTFLAAFAGVIIATTIMTVVSYAVRGAVTML